MATDAPVRDVAPDAPERAVLFLQAPGCPAWTTIAEGESLTEPGRATPARFRQAGEQGDVVLEVVDKLLTPATLRKPSTKLILSPDTSHPLGMGPAPPHWEVGESWGGAGARSSFGTRTRRVGNVHW